MALERTLSIVKPDGVARNLIGEVIGRFEKAGLKVVARRMVHLSQRDAEGFYAVHAARPFFKDLGQVHDFGSGARAGARRVKAPSRRIARSWAPPIRRRPRLGTIRADLAESIEANTVHGSDAPETAAKEIAYFFRDTEICPRG
jgi:nucleoside-diphosphate kinase